jgi:hypothetical protein
MAPGRSYLFKAHGNISETDSDTIPEGFVQINRS